MRLGFALLALALFSGCIGPDSVGTTTISTQAPADFASTTSTTGPSEDAVYIIPTTTTSAARSSLPAPTTSTVLDPLMSAYEDSHSPICLVDGKPVVRMYGKMSCDHCNWSGPIFDDVVAPYVDQGSIIAHHWVFDRQDDALTPDPEGGIPQPELDAFYSANQTTIPFFSFGCRFTRAGSISYVQRDRQKEAETFRAAIEQIIKESS